MLENIFLISLTMSLPILILAATVPILRKRYSAKWTYWAWLVLAIRLIIPFRYEPAQAPVQLPPIPSFNITINNTYESAPDTNEEENKTPAVPSHKSDYLPVSSSQSVISVREILGIIWFGGMFMFLCYHIFGYLIFKKKAVSGCKIKDIYNCIPVYTCSKINSPMMLGFFKSKILLPEENFTDEELSVILKHEFTHYKRKDLWYKLLLLAANAVHWFNPFVYLMVKHAGRDLEYSCDDEVVKNSSIAFRKNYSMTILKSMKKE